MTGAPAADAGADVPLDAGLSAALDELLARRPVLLAFDFDGVLSPIVEEPSAARALPGSTELLAELAAAQGVHVALVSGRALADLRAVTSTPDDSRLLLVGSHGAEPSGDTRPPALTDDAASRLETLTARFGRIAADHPGVHVERKPTAVVLHTRRASRPDATTATDRALSAADEVSGHVTHGKEVVEVAFIETGKGVALQRLRHQLGVQAVLYAGDDVTDENAFAVLRANDLGIKVGEGDTRAGHRVAGPAEVQQVLRQLARAAG